MKIIFGRETDEKTGKLTEQHNEQLNALYSSTSIFRVIRSRRIRLARRVSGMWETRGAYRVLVGKSEGKSPLGIPRLRVVENIKMVLQEVR